MHNNNMRRRWALGLVALALGVGAVGVATSFQADEVSWTQGSDSQAVVSGTPTLSNNSDRIESLEVSWT